MNLSEARYILEHNLFPQWFFSDRLNFAGAVVQKENNVPYDVMKNICKNEGVECKYKPEQYKVEFFKLDNNSFLIKLSFPEPENTPLCYRAYMLFNEEFTQASYFTAERSFDEKVVLCAWDKDKSHINYGLFNGNEKQEMLKVIELYLSQFPPKNK